MKMPHIMQFTVFLLIISLFIVVDSHVPVRSPEGFSIGCLMVGAEEQRIL